MTLNRTSRKARYNKKTYTQVLARVPQEKAKLFATLLDKNGQTKNGFINECIDDYIRKKSEK